MKRWTVAILMIVLLLIIGCGSAGEGEAPTSTAPAAATVAPAMSVTPAETSAPAATPSVPTATAIPAATGVSEEPDDAAATDPPLAGLAEGWSEVKPAGATACAKNTAYAFYVRPGDPARVMIHLQGGGACWFGDSCRLGQDQTYDATVSVDDNPARAPFGLFDLDNPENPVADYTMVYVPYCTGDVHLGDQETTYQATNGDEIGMNHGGYDNVASALAWVEENVTAPDTIFVNGSSAGAIASPVYAALLADIYPDARVVQLGDGAGGYRAPGAAPELIDRWGTAALLREELGFPLEEEGSLTFEQLYLLAARRHPDIQFAQFNTVEDDAQRFFLSLIGRPNVSLEPLLEENLAEIAAEVKNFATFTAGGEMHTILQRPEFYTYAAGGERVVEWVSALLDGPPPATVKCAPCDAPEIITAEEAAGLPALADLPAEWSELKTFGDTLCADGSDFSFFVHPGESEKLMIFFQGGGACWDRSTCNPAGFGTYDRDVSAMDNPATAPFGIFNRDNPDNPVADYTTVFVPYCTGDVHLGNSTATYGSGDNAFTIEHRGLANASAALAWTFENVSAPEQVLVTGSSAGAIPSPFYTRFVAEQYPDARIVQLGDGAGGYRVGDGAFLLTQWGTSEALAAYPEYSNIPTESLTFETLYTATGTRYTNVVLSQYNTAADQTQRLFLTLLGVDSGSLLELLLANYADIRAGVPDFVTYTAGGDLHTILQRPEFYTISANGVLFSDWFFALLNGNPVETVLCANCTTAEESVP